MRKFAIVALSALALAGTAQAKDMDMNSPAALTVATADLDLTSAAGQETLTARIESAAEKVCARPFIRDLKGMQSFQECMTTAIANANATFAAGEDLALVAPRG